MRDDVDSEALVLLGCCLIGPTVGEVAPARPRPERIGVYRVTGPVGGGGGG